MSLLHRRNLEHVWHVTIFVTIFVLFMLWTIEVFCAQRLTQVMGSSQWRCLPALNILATSSLCTQNLRSNYMQKLWLMSFVTCHNNGTSTHGEAFICIAGVSTRRHEWYCQLCAHVRLLTGWSFILLISATLDRLCCRFKWCISYNLNAYDVSGVSWRPRQQPKKSWGDIIGQCRRRFCIFSFFYWFHILWLFVDAKEIVSYVLPCVMSNLTVPSC